jgi:HEAT repeat protein
MDGFSSKRILTAISCLVMMGAAGCAEITDNLPSWVPLGGKVTDTLPGVPTPAQRIATLRRLSQEAAWRKPEQKQQIAEELAQAIRAEPDAMIRAEIVHTLGEYPGPTADRVLKAALGDPDPDVRMSACRAWTKREGAEATEALIGLLSGDLNPEVRLAAARALGERKDRAAVPALGNALEDSDPAMQYRAVLSLRQITGEDFGNDVNLWRQYVQGQTPQPAKSISLAERLRHMF